MSIYCLTLTDVYHYGSNRSYSGQVVSHMLHSKAIYEYNYPIDSKRVIVDSTLEGSWPVPYRSLKKDYFEVCTLERGLAGTSTERIAYYCHM